MAISAAQQVHEVRVYLNTEGDIVISRHPHDWERHEPGQDDIFIVIPKLFVPRFVERVKQLFAEAS